MNSGKLTISVMKEQEAREIVIWEYDPPYSIYNMTDDSDSIQELMDGSYFSVTAQEGELIGFFCYGRNAQVPGGIRQGLYIGDSVLDIGLGLRPELTGMGRGLDFLQAGLKFGQQKYAPATFRLSVASFNHRAISLYRKAGFRQTGAFINTYGETEQAFFLMEKS
ncbi:GNAT family N-acetyltransferase [Paenibacillus sp. HW567]|uniref:GNAT family N-acetyltransferase n=1 Tax=Paenibacillus sp. HW567 TaxID=1034769 RepID=UPI0003602D5B|nr:GNAT family N-acetyltransferase [Paenibacillus sp. HW567]